MSKRRPLPSSLLKDNDGSRSVRISSKQPGSGEQPRDVATCFSPRAPHTSPDSSPRMSWKASGWSGVKEEGDDEGDEAHESPAEEVQRLPDAVSMDLRNSANMTGKRPLSGAWNHYYNRPCLISTATQTMDDSPVCDSRPTSPTCPNARPASRCHSSLSGRVMSPTSTRGRCHSPSPSIWAPPAPASPPTPSRPSTARRQWAVAGPGCASPEVDLDVEASLYRQLNQTRNDLTNTATELSETKAKLALISPKQRNALRRAEELVLLRSCPRGGAAREDAQFRFLPACGPKEIVCARKRIAEFEVPNEYSAKIKKLKERLQEADAAATLERERMAKLEDKIAGLLASSEELLKQNATLEELVQNVSDFVSCRKKQSKPSEERRLFQEMEQRVKSLKQARRGSDGGDRQSSHGTCPSRQVSGESYAGDTGRTIVDKAARTQWLWDLATGFARRLTFIKGTDMHPSHRSVAALLNEFHEKCSEDFNVEGNDMRLSEFITYRLYVEEFNTRVAVNANNWDPAESGLASMKSTEDIELVMKERYDEAFQISGGKKLLDQCIQIVGSKLRELRMSRGNRRTTQDCGYDILGLDKLYKINMQRREKFVYEISRLAKKTNAYPYLPDLKGRDRARQKSLTKYGNDISCLTDLLRGSLTYRSIDDLYSGLHEMIDEDLAVKRADFYIREVEDRFLHPKGGYRDVMVLFDVDGVIGEIQLHSNLLMQAKKGGGHHAYKMKRMTYELVFEACVRNSEAELVALITQHHTCAHQVRDKNGRTALHYTCQHGSIVGARLLLQYDADPWAMDEHGTLPCELALKTGHADVLDLVLTRMYVSLPPGALAVRRFVESAVLWWCDSTSYRPMDVRDSLKGAWKQTGEKMIQVLNHHADFGGLRVLEAWFLRIVSKASVLGNLERARVILTVGFDMKVPGQRLAGKASAMDLAVEHGQLEMVKLLHFFAIEQQLQCCTCWTCSANLHLAEASKNENGPKAVAALAAGADPNHLDTYAASKKTPLMSFAAAANLHVCEQLIAFKAQVATIDNFRCNALHYARVFGNEEVEEYLKSTAKSMAHLGLKPGQDISKYVLDGVQGGCAGCLHLAQHTADEETFKAALEQRVGPFENTLLHMAVDVARGNDPRGQVVRALLRLKASPVTKNSRDATAMHNAVYAGHEDLYNRMLTEVEQTLGLEALDSLEGMDGSSFAKGARAVLARAKKKEDSKLAKTKQDQGLDANKDDNAGNALLLKAAFACFQHSLLAAHLLQLREGSSASFGEKLEKMKQRDKAGDPGDEGSDGCSEAGSRASRKSKASRMSKGSRMSAKSRKSAASKASSAQSRRHSTDSMKQVGRASMKGTGKPKLGKRSATGLTSAMLEHQMREENEKPDGEESNADAQSVNSGAGSGGSVASVAVSVAASVQTPRKKGMTKSKTMTTRRK